MASDELLVIDRPRVDAELVFHVRVIVAPISGGEDGLRSGEELMGFRFRRSFGRGPLRFTLSRSGLSGSVGRRGLRLGRSRRRSYLSAGIPGTGLSWFQRFRRRR
jgi:hypothetical protein